MSVISGLYKLLYMPMCRVYARHILRDKPADSVMRCLCSPYFWFAHEYWPNFKNPRSFSEKIWNRMLFDRNPIWTMLSDKLRVRNYVVEKVGREYLIPLLWVGDKVEEIPFDELPLKFVIKANHGCGYNIIVNDNTQLDRTKARLQLKKWLGENFCQDKYFGTEWAYRNIKPTIIVESFLDEDGNVPLDYKFFCYLGRVEFIQIDIDRFEDHSEKFFDRDFNHLDFELKVKQYPGKVERPNKLDDMVCVAERLARGLDFIRVDLYSVGARIYVGELTCYPSGGTSWFAPREYDYLFGEKWKSK